MWSLILVSGAAEAASRRFNLFSSGDYASANGRRFCRKAVENDACKASASRKRLLGTLRGICDEKRIFDVFDFSARRRDDGSGRRSTTRRAKSPSSASDGVGDRRDSDDRSGFRRRVERFRGSRTFDRSSGRRSERAERGSGKNGRAGIRRGAPGRFCADSRSNGGDSSGARRRQ